MLSILFMPPKTRFTREDVLTAAFELVQSEGVKELSTRKVAERLNSSTAPIYSSFGSMTELEKEIILKVRDLLLEYTKRDYTSIAFLNMGVGFVVFGRDQPMLFSSLFLEGNRFKEVVRAFNVSLEERLPGLPVLEGLNEEERKLVLKKMATYSIGLATLACTGLLDDDSDERIIYEMNAMGMDVIDAALGKLEAGGKECPRR